MMALPSTVAWGRPWGRLLTPTSAGCHGRQRSYPCGFVHPRWDAATPPPFPLHRSCLSLYTKHSSAINRLGRPQAGKLGKIGTVLLNSQPHHECHHEGSLWHAAGSLVVLIGGGLLFWHWHQHAPPRLLHARSRRPQRELTPEEIVQMAGKRQPGLPEYTRGEVGYHDSIDKRVWVIYKNGVYDVTEFLPEHPGGRNLLMAAGGSVEPFWEIYAVHMDNPQVLRLLEQYRVGNLSVSDVWEQKKAFVYGDGPFSQEPVRENDLVLDSLTPYNAETPLDRLVDEFYTPNDLFYIRNHLPTPDVKPHEYELEVSSEGMDKKKVELSLEDIKQFPKHTLTAVIQCGGNRRSEMNRHKPVRGLNWGAGAIGNAKWSGAPLRDVLESLGYNESDCKSLHVQFEAQDIGADGSPYGASIPGDRAFNGDVLLAYEMNGKQLPRDHGFPLRVIVPGVVGARQVKWLNRIVVSKEESQSHWQQHDYKIFGPQVNWDKVDFSTQPPIYEMPVTSVVCQPEKDSDVVAGEMLQLKGYAWSGGGRKIARVDVTADGGKTWTEAKLESEDAVAAPRHYGWTLWTAKVLVPQKTSRRSKVEVWSKAVDSAYNVQPEGFDSTWNLRGLLSNAYNRVLYNIVPK